MWLVFQLICFFFNSFWFRTHGRRIERLTDECGNEEIARFLYQCKPDGGYIRWIPFDKFRNVEYLAKGGFGEVHKATWINYYDSYDEEHKDRDVVLKRIHNSNDKMVDVLNEVK